ncbi:MAG: electron transfer flavoprotein subunit alpha/FixB family protein [Oscillospiraceae bacterium]|jgi:electron transfer flavoprotein alpha subunit|nr:electron transfer flavoprotein subunit alpha/FixB family protein [Oscillospiraceae bacterium]
MRITDADKPLFTNVWIIAETVGGAIQPVTYELIGAARGLADARGSRVAAIVVGGEADASLFAYGADIAIVVNGPEFVGFNDELECASLNHLIGKYKPEIVLCAATARGRALIPRAAVRTVSGLTADCTGLAIDPETGDLLQTRPAFGGNIMATIRASNHRPQMATVRPNVMKALPPDPTRKGETIREQPPDAGVTNAKRVIETVRGGESGVNLADAKVIVSGGRAMRGPEGFAMLKRLADKLGGAVGASRAAVDAGWIAYPHQVGQTGQTVQTALYIACGISGQIQHLVGMQSCGCIVAIDRNPDTPMMKLADIAVTGDLFEVVPALAEALG